MKLIFEKGSTGRRLDLISPCDVPQVSLEKAYIHEKQSRLPHLPENEINRHYMELVERSYGANDGFYPSGSCTMRYSPKVNEEAAVLKGPRGVHLLQPEVVVQGSMEVLCLAERYLCEITGMDAMTFQPAVGTHGESMGLPLIKTYHVHHNDTKHAKIIIPDSAHGINPVGAAMCGYGVVGISSGENGCTDLEQLKVAMGGDMAGPMLINPNTVGLFDKNTLEITKTVHDTSGLCHYDGTNLNVVMSIVRPGDTGFDAVHLNLHKTLSASHGGGRPGDGPVGCKEFLEPSIPGVRVEREEGVCYFAKAQESIGDVKMFYDNFLVMVKTLTCILIPEKKGTPEAVRNMVLNANYMRVELSGIYSMAYNGTCMYELVMSLEEMEHGKDVSTMGITRALLDYSTYLPTMYFPLIVYKVPMAEPTETEPKETLDEAIKVFHGIYEQTLADLEALHSAPHLTLIGRPDEVTTAHKLVPRYIWE